MNSDINSSTVHSSKAVSATALLNRDIKTLDYLWEPYIVKKTISIFSGSSDVGKSSFLRQLSIAISSGSDEFLGKKLHAEHKSVLYIATEDYEDTMAYLLTKQMAGSIYQEKPENLYFLFNCKEVKRDIERELRLRKFDAIIIDSIADVFRGQINDIRDVRKFLNQFHDICYEHDCAIILLHHTGKRTEKLEASKNNIIGSQGIEGKARAVFELRKDSNPGVRQLWVTKGNLLPESVKSTAMLLNFDEHQNFHFTGETKEVEIEAVAQRYPEKEKIVKRLRVLKDVDGLSFKKAHESLKREFNKVPGETTLKSWYHSGQTQKEED